MGLKFCLNCIETEKEYAEAQTCTSSRVRPWLNKYITLASRVSCVCTCDYWDYVCVHSWILYFASNRSSMGSCSMWVCRVHLWIRRSADLPSILITWLQIYIKVIHHEFERSCTYSSSRSNLVQSCTLTTMFTPRRKTWLIWTDTYVEGGKCCAHGSPTSLVDVTTYSM